MLNPLGLFKTRLLQWHNASVAGTSKASDVGAVCANGDPCGYVHDLAGNSYYLRNGVWASGGVNAQRPTFNNSGGVQYWSFDGTQGFINDQIVSTGNKTIFAVAKIDTIPGVYQTLWAIKDDSSHRSQAIFAGAAISANYPILSVGNAFINGQIVGGSNGWALDTDWHSFVFILQDSNNTRTTARIFVDGIEQSKAVSISNFSHVTDGAVGANIASGSLSQGLIGKIKEFGTIDGVISDSELVALHHYLSRYSVTSNAHKTRPVIVCDGDSLTYGEVATSITDADSYPGQMAALLDVPCRIINLGYSGQTSAQAHADFAAQGQKYRAKQALNIAVLWYGSNDLGGNGGSISAASLHSNMTTLVSDYRSAGYDKIIVLTVLPRTYAGDPGDYETKRQDYRALVVPGLGGDSCGADAVVDIAAKTTIGDSGDQNNTTYYNADTVHLKTAGYAIVAQAVADVINTWI